MKKRSYELLIANRKYKDTIFRWIFSQIENLLSLYNAVTGKHYQNPEELEIVTLENAIYMGMKNDLAFVLEMGLTCMNTSLRITQIFRCGICST